MTVRPQGAFGRRAGRPDSRSAPFGRNTPFGRTGIAGLTRNLFHLPNAPRLSPPSAGHWRLPVTATPN
ncbi:MAG: hypothetical protein LBD35_00015 [Prevotellaceae bacterium]|nr:hypothetical protein [Prevotellaceae bacterium]